MTSKKRKLPEGEEADYVSKPPRILSNIHLRNQEKRLIIILEQAQLESAKVCYKSLILLILSHLLNSSLLFLT